MSEANRRMGHDVLYSFALVNSLRSPHNAAIYDKLTALTRRSSQATPRAFDRLSFIQCNGDPNDNAFEELSKVIGTPMYMAPEVITLSNYDERADIYSFGMLMADVLMDGKIKKLFQDAGGQLSSSVLLKLVAQGWRVKIPSMFVIQVPVVVNLIQKR